MPPLLLLFGSAAAVAAADSDGDGLRDALESRSGGVLDPLRADSDGDGVIDAAEDDDGDGLGNLGEQRFGARPDRRDSDGDGLPDGREDRDRDGRSDALEQDRRPVPASLRPPLSRATHDLAPFKGRCGVPPGGSRLRVCGFGDPSSSTTIAVMGDSHAQQLTPALKLSAETQGWHLVTLIKGACPPVLGTLAPGQHGIDAGASCASWRTQALSWLRRQPPTLIVLTHSDGYALLGRDGRPLSMVDRVAQWRRGMALTLARMPRTSRLLILGDTPKNDEDPVDCLMRHRGDMSACVSRRLPSPARTIERAIRQVSIDQGARHRTLYPKVCSYDPCPLVQGGVLIYRDRAHLTATFARQLTPSVTRLLEAALRRPR